MPGFNLEIPPEALAPIIRQAVAEALAAAEADRAKLNGKLAYSEAEAAELLGLEPSCLRDERLRGRIQASAIVGRCIRYMHEDLVNYLLGRRWNGPRRSEGK
jgi:hypothetical protein